MNKVLTVLMALVLHAPTEVDDIKAIVSGITGAGDVMAKVKSTLANLVKLIEDAGF